jgi:crotonobetainyl-CoA:carnitine CoA-transferase CaiB-like acyl-CoA transferase
VSEGLREAGHQLPGLASLWGALGGDRSRLHDVVVDNRARFLPSGLAVDALAVGAVGAALLAAAELAEARGAGRPRASLDAEHVALAFASERHLRDTDPTRPPLPTPFAGLSRFAPTRDGGWIRLHANYEHHRRALLDVLGTDEGGAATALAERDAVELETAIVAAGGVAAAVRTEEAWAVHPQGRALAALPLVERRDLGPAVPAPPSDRSEVPASRPASGVRVLDLTRVIAGPVATRMLAALGADVLRIDPPHLPELELQVLDGCVGKRMAELDLQRQEELAVLHELLDAADVLVHGYRPGALAAFGLDDAALAERHPQLVVTSLSAWGHTGLWGGRRGFDSLVQAACGIAVREATAEGKPGALPVQALDHATGYLMAAAVLRGLAVRRREGRVEHSRLALARTALELQRLPQGARADDVAEPDPERHRLDLGGLSVISPPGALDGTALRWEQGPRAAEPRW